VANTYTQIYIQVVFAVKGRRNLLQKPWRETVFKYMAGIMKEKGQKPIIVNGVADHVHVFIGFKPSCSLSDLVRDIKNNSSRFINEKDWVNGKFSWQAGYGAFSYGHSQIERVYQYILNQEKHHQQKTFKQEYTEFLEKFDIDYKNEYVFDFLDRRCFSLLFCITPSGVFI